MKQLKKKQLFLLSGFSAFLLILPWMGGFSGIILFVAFIPLLIIERHLYENRELNKPVYSLHWSYLVFFIWNLFTTYWIYNATIFGAVVAILLNSLFMAVVFWLFHLTHRTLGHKFGYFSLIVYWTGFEYIYLNADLSWPWLNLGNGFAKDLNLIQWYEFTGATSATPWILMINILLFIILLDFILKKNLRDNIFEIAVAVILIFFPLILSMIMFHSYEEHSDPYDIVVVQPNIDPYNDKFGGLSNYDQLTMMFDLADSLTDSGTDYVVFPETAINDNIWENNFYGSMSIQRIKRFIEKYPQVVYITGVTSHYSYNDDEAPSITSRKFNDSDRRYEVYNAGIQVDSTAEIQTYHKSKLVVGVEKMPFPRLLRSLEKHIIKLGGTTGSYGTQDERTTLNTPGRGRVGIMICYESVYGEFVTDYVKNNANLLFVITNDGWWGNTPGYKQHLSYSSLRAIETRRSIARSANTGISCFINQKGEISQATDWWVPDVIRAEINANEEVTYYVQHGDFVSRVALFFGIITFIYTVVTTLIQRRKKASA